MMQIAKVWKTKALDNPAVIERCAGDNKRYNIVLRYLRNNDIIGYSLEWEDAVDCINKINGIEIESSEK